ncbi:ornithine cyclodeaminase family protein [Bordetella sp. LUAb4]|uniref:ornithine cyclodeaminase family protein n=1 Tax=Bordetella sp. LUAb4 TaxID=2843195 RepID=UPI001E5CD4B9|nr:ornithine cyclodeaminase family protein [Bordetella sp. LUAb4]
MDTSTRDTAAYWLTEADVARLVPLDDGIDALERNLIELADGAAFNVPKALGDLGGGAMHALGSASPRLGVCGFKTWVHTRNGAKAVFSLFSSENGRLLAMLEANTLGQIRTAAMTALGTRWLAREDAGDLAVIGTGKQAIAQIHAVAAVRTLRRIRVWGRDAERRAAFARNVAEAFPQTSVEAAASLEAATDGADLVTLVTRATDAFFPARLLAPGAHLNAVGAILPANAEFQPDVFARARAVVVDDLANARRGSRELRDYYGDEDAAWGQVQVLADVIRAGKPRAGSGQGKGEGVDKGAGDITLFKAMGMGLSDLAVAALAHERAAAAPGAVTPLPVSAAAAAIRWRRDDGKGGAC